MVRWLRWHCPPDTGFEIRALAVWGRARYLSVTEAPYNTNFHTWMGKKQFCFFQTAETGNRTPDSGVKGSGANHYPRAPALKALESAVFSMAMYTIKTSKSPYWTKWRNHNYTLLINIVILFYFNQVKQQPMIYDILYSKYLINWEILFSYFRQTIHLPLARTMQPPLYVVALQVVNGYSRAEGSVREVKQEL